MVAGRKYVVYETIEKIIYSIALKWSIMGKVFSHTLNLFVVYFWQT